MQQRTKARKGNSSSDREYVEEDSKATSVIIQWKGSDGSQDAFSWPNLELDIVRIKAGNLLAVLSINVGMDVVLPLFIVVSSWLAMNTRIEADVPEEYAKADQPA